jgi:hypothetical protein
MGGKQERTRSRSPDMVASSIPAFPVVSFTDSVSQFKIFNHAGYLFIKCFKDFVKIHLTSSGLISRPLPFYVLRHHDNKIQIEPPGRVVFAGLGGPYDKSEASRILLIFFSKKYSMDFCLISGSSPEL